MYFTLNCDANDANAWIAVLKRVLKGAIISTSLIQCTDKGSAYFIDSL